MWPKWTATDCIDPLVDHLRENFGFRSPPSRSFFAAAAARLAVLADYMRVATLILVGAPVVFLLNAASALLAAARAVALATLPHRRKGYAFVARRVRVLRARSASILSAFARMHRRAAVLAKAAVARIDAYQRAQFGGVTRPAARAIAWSGAGLAVLAKTALVAILALQGLILVWMLMMLGSAALFVLALAAERLL